MRRTIEERRPSLGSGERTIGALMPRVGVQATNDLAVRVEALKASVPGEDTIRTMTTALAIDHDRIADFCRRWRVTEFALFGSILRADFRPDSDVDVLLTFEPGAPWTLWDLSRMRTELESII